MEIVETDDKNYECNLTNNDLRKIHAFLEGLSNGNDFIQSVRNEKIKISEIIGYKTKI